MRNTQLYAVSALLAALAITGCTSKPTVTTPNASTLPGGNGVDGANGANGANATGLNADGSLQSQNLTAAQRVLLGRVVHFELDSSEIAQSDFAVLNAHARYLASNGGAHVVLTGHTDERGTREYNLALGERRAKSVQTYLQTNGAQQAQIEVVSYGKEKPVDEGHDESAWSKNRRVEIGYDKLDPNK